MTRPADIAAWRERWRPLTPSVAATIIDELVHGAAVTTAPFGQVDGRIDLRGLPYGAAAGLGQSVGGEVMAEQAREGQGPEWVGLDLSGADMPEMRWRQLTLRDVVLDDAVLTGLRCWGVRVLGCSMKRANLYSGQLGPSAEWWPIRSHWCDVNLERADLRRCHSSSRFEHVNFSNAKITKVDLGWSDLVDCQFAGVVNTLTIGKRPIQNQPRGWRLERVDLTHAKPRNIELIGVNLGSRDVDLRLPQDDDHWRVDDWRDFLDRVGRAVAEVDDVGLQRTGRIWHDYAVQDSGPSQSVGFVGVWDLRNLGGDALVDLLGSCRSF